MSQASQYRADIDGLRAIAVLAVILFHFEIPGFTGGFTGVDVFFVISGYLIIRIIMREISEGNFSLVNFWERRVRRIMPAMVVVLAATAIGAYNFILLPADFVDFGTSLISQSLFVSNWWFMTESEYFAAPAETMPLLHTWTLAVEEQFYIFFPLLAVGLYPFLKRRFGVFLVGVALLSFVYNIWLSIEVPLDRFSIPFVPNIWGSAENASAAFYFILPRMWEFLVGGLIAVYALTITNRTLAEVVSVGGLTAIVAGIFMIGESDPFPGFVGLLPVLGTAAVIVANAEHKTKVFQLLSWAPFVWVGLISYSLYLWHWPAVVFSKYELYNGDTLSNGTIFWLLVLVFILSMLTYRLVERPFRQKKYLADRTWLFGTAFVSLVVLVGVGQWIVRNDGFPGRISAEAQLIAAAIEDVNPRKDECFTRSEFGGVQADAEPCLLGEQDETQIDFVLWGDSHANATMPAFDAYGIETGQTGVFFGAAGCAPLLSEEDLAIKEKLECVEQTQLAVSFIQENPTTEVFMVSEWTEGYALAGVEYGPYLSKLLTYTVAQLPTETPVTIFSRIQTFPDVAFRDLFMSAHQGKLDLGLEEPRGPYEAALASINDQIAIGTVEFENVTVINPVDGFCNEKMCRLGTEDGLYYHDSSHVSVYGAQQTILPLLLEHHEQNAVSSE